MTLILLTLLGWGLGLVLVLVLMRMAGPRDRAARHGQKRRDPLADATITQSDQRASGAMTDDPTGRG